MSLTACEDKVPEEQPQTEEGPKEHTSHSWKREYAYDAEYHWLECSGCDATGFKGAHNWDEGTITTQPTETSDGVKTFKCGKCGATKTAPVSLGENGHVHVWKDVYDSDVDYHWIQCSVCGDVKEKVGHTFDDGVVTTEPTQDTEGVKTYTCSVCNKTKEEPLPSIGSGHTHAWSDTYSFNDIDHWKACSGCDQKKDVNRHTWNDGVVTKEPTQTEKGTKTFTCTVCATTKTENIPALGTGDANEVDGYVLVDSIQDEDNLYIVSSADGITYNVMTAQDKGPDYPWYFIYGLTDYELTKNGITSMDTSAEKFRFVKQNDGTYIIQTRDGLYLYSYVETNNKGTHYSISTCNTTAADKGGTVYWNITKKDNGFIIKGKTTNVYLSQSSQSFCGYDKEPSWPIYLFEPGKVTVTNNGNGGNDDYTGALAEDSRWNLDFTQYGYTFRDTLATLMRAKVTKTTSYSACLGIGQGAAAKGSGYVPFYHNEAHGKDESCNREHTWPNSRGGGKNAGGNEIEEDPYMVRPTLTKDNSDRGNNFYGIGSAEWDPASCGFEGARGESARVIFYVATKYGKSHGLTLSNNPGDAASKKTMGTLKYLVEWNRKYPVTDMEKQINNNLEKAGFGRNPFVDHPEYAEFIWTTTGVQTSVPAGIDVGGNGGGGSGNGSGGTGQDIPPQPSYEYSLVTSLEELDGASAYIVTNGKAMKSTNPTKKSDGSILTWYFDAAEAEISSDKTGMNVSGAQKFTFTKVSDGVFTMKTPENKYLYSYIDGTHYSIGLKATSDGINFLVETLDDGYIIKGQTTNVYIALGSPSFQGTSTKPTTPIYLYK